MTVTPYSYREYTGNAANRDFQVPFPYLLKAHVKVYTGLDLATGAYTSLLVDGTNYAWTSTTNIQLTTAPAAGVKLTVKRETPTGDLLAQWQDGSTLVAEDLLTSDKQNLYAVQEEQDILDIGVALSVSATATANAATATANAAAATANAANAEVSNRWSKVTETITSAVAWLSSNGFVPTTAAVENRIDLKVDAAIAGDIYAGTDLAVTANSPSTGNVTIRHNVTGANIATANSGGSVIRNLTITAQGHVTDVGSVNLDGRYYTQAQADNLYVNLASSQTVDGVKVFTSSPVVPTPSSGTGVANKAYVDSYVGASSWNKTTDTIASNETWVNGDSNIPTAAAVTGRIVDLLNDIGSYVVVATEVTFPNAGIVDGAGQPDPGVLVEITDASGLAWDGAGTSTNATRANGSAVTITGITGTSPISGCGAQLLSTSTLHSYTFVKWTIASGVAQTISDNIAEILVVDTNAAAAAASASAAASSQLAAAASASAAATSASQAGASATNAANSAAAASSLVSTITNLDYLLNWGLITEAAGVPPTNYGVL
jgi:hypothetical protein